MNISENGLNLIKKFEGCYLTAYLCPANVWTIGWGTTGTVDGKAICKGMTITQQKANSLLIEKLASYENAVNKLGVQFNQNQYDALVSFCYNLGTGIFTGNLLKSIKAKKWEDVARQMKLYNKARVQGVLTELTGLTRRRNAEAELFLTPVKNVTKDDKELADSVSKIIKSGISLQFNSWKRMDLFDMKNVDALINKLGGINKLIGDGVISSTDIWKTKKYNENHVRSLLVKFASKL